MKDNQLDNFKGKQELLDIKVKLASPEDWQACRDLRLLSITGPDAEMFGLTSEKVEDEKNKDESEWRKETQSRLMFSVLAWNNLKPVGLGRVNMVENGLWRIRNGYVLPEFHGLGIQQKMIALRLREIIKRGGVKAITGIKNNNLISIHNVEKFGFKIIDTDKDWHTLESDLTNIEVIKKIDEVLNAG